MGTHATARLVHHIDAAHWLSDGSAALAMDGWCSWTDGRALSRVVARVRSKAIAAANTHPRDDVAAALRQPHARLSGFHLRVPHVELTDSLEIAAEDSAGSQQVFFSIRAGDLPGKGPVILDYPAMRKQGWGAVDPTTIPSLPARTAAAAPLFSVLLPVHNTAPRLLEECIESVLQQTFPDWELCIVDDASADPRITTILETSVRRNSQVRVIQSAARLGIARTTNRALEGAIGRFIVLLDHDDRLLPQALASLAATIEGPTPCDVLYTDEEKIAASGEPVVPILKPAFSPEFLRGVMYVGHLLCVRRNLALAVGGFDPAYDGIQDFEFLLRISERTQRIVHVPAILYQWRMTATSSSLHGNIKGDIDRLQASAVEAHLARIGRFDVVRPLGNHRIALDPAPGFRRPRITIVASPDAAASGVLTSIADADLVISRRTDLATLSTRPEPPTTLLQQFSLPAAPPMEPHLLVFVSEAIREGSSAWLDRLAALAMLPDSRFVSPVLRSADDRIVSCGATLDSEGALIPIMRGYDPSGDGYNGSLRCHREILAASPTCWMLRVAPTDGSAPRYNRVCATAWLRIDRPWLDVAAAPSMATGVSGRDPFFNAAFNRRHADYRLAT